MVDVMEGWSDFYTLVGSTAATLIGLIFVVISLGADHASLLFSALAMMAPLSDMARALAVGLIGCAGLGYMVNLAFLVPKGIKAEERQPIWFGILPLVAYTGFLMTAAAWALASSLAPEIGGLACVVLLVAALHNCWTMTLIIISRPS